MKIHGLDIRVEIAPHTEFRIDFVGQEFVKMWPITIDLALCQLNSYGESAFNRYSFF